MAYPAGFSSDEDDDINAFLDDDPVEEPINIHQNGPPELTLEQKSSNLFYAIMNGNLQGVITALDEGLDVNLNLKDGWTQLLLAASVGNVEIVRELISRGADVNAERDKFTVLMAVCSCPKSTAPASKCLDILMQLIEKGANVNAITRKRETALMFAASNGNAEIVAKLLSYCNIEAEDNQGWNALFWAANDNKPQIVQILLDAGLNPEKIDMRCNTAVYYAISQEHDEIIKLLQPEEDLAISVIQDSFYEFEKLFEDKRPQFFRDICCMLSGMRCENLGHLFTDISLRDFLSLNDSNLLALGVSVPYQRKRILAGLHKFHKYPYKQKSMPIVPKDELYSTIDFSNGLLAAVRQIMAMEASLKYMAESDSASKENENCHNNQIQNLRLKIMGLNVTARHLNLLAKTWDPSSKPVDLISTCNQKTSKLWIRWFGYMSIALFTTIAVCKIQKAT